MSIFAMTWAYKQELACAHKFVLVTLADAANALNECWPSQASLAKRCGLSRRYVITVLAELERDGFIAKVPRTRANGATTSCQYRLSAPVEADWAASPDQSPPVNPVHTPCEPSSHPLCTPFTPPVNPVHPHYVEPKLEPKKKLPPLKSPTGDDGFEVFWQVYPKKVAKPAALKAWAKARKGADPPTIIEGARRYVAAHPSGYEYWKNPSGWLNDARWTDEQRATNGTPNGHNKPLRPLTDAETEEIIRRSHGG